MTDTEIALKIESYMPFKPTSDQADLFGIVGQFILHSKRGDVLIISGYAGTGKTTVISILSKLLKDVGIKSVMIAPTGRAAKVMSQYSNTKAYTIHKKIYRQKSALVDAFVIDINKDNLTYYIVDEASMINDSSYDSIFGSGNLLADMVEYINGGKNCRLIVVGDKGQLPPVGRAESPALDPSVMEYYSQNLYTANLTTVVRQKDGSAILENATIVRSLIEQGFEDFPRLRIASPEFKSIQGGEFFDEIEDAYARFGKEETIVITRSNKQATRANSAIRNRVLYMEEEISSGDLLMVVKNNYSIVNEDDEIGFIANGDVAKIKRLRRYEELFDMRFVEATLLFSDYDDTELECKMMLDTLYSDTPSLSSEKSKALFFEVEKDYSDITDKRKRYQAIKEDKYFNALQVKFAYAITCHKAQGGQWDCVFIDRLIFGDETMTIDMLRWLYTAITRAKKRVVLINFDERFFDQI
ncbi:MAG: AAA family ATPase [Rikenellaceae bacterium]